MVYQNIHGRTGGRGLRHWLLIPKLLGIATYFGGLVAAAAIILVFKPETAGQWRDLTQVLRAIFVFAAIPGLTVAMICGLLLLRQHNWALWRMRWMKIKLAILLITLPVLHLFMSGRLERIRETGEGGTAMTQFNIGLTVAIVTAIVVIVLGRHKPRLRQPGRTLAQPRPPQQSPPPQSPPQSPTEPHHAAASEGAQA
ncbi:MAG: hypothetical protein WD294_00140 [Phycisphaeraceae bacterium]